MDEKDENKRISKVENKKITKLVISQSKIAQKLKEIDKLIEEQRLKDLEESVMNNESYVSVNVANSKEKQVIVKVKFRYDLDKIKIYNLQGRPFTSFDQMVHDAIVSIYCAGKTCFTAEDVYRVCNSQTLHIGEELLKKYDESINDSRFRVLIIDATEQLKNYCKSKNIKENNPKKATYEEYFLPLSKISIVMNNNKVVDGYAFLATPPLYRYSADYGQIVNVPIQLLVDSRFQNSQEGSVYNFYLVKRIEAMKSNPKLERKILYQTIFKELDIDFESLARNVKMKKRRIILERLNYFKRWNYIKDFTEYKNGCSIIGVEIVW